MGGPCPGASLIWHWQHSRLPGQLGWADLWLFAGACWLHVRSIGTRQTAGCTVLVVLLWMLAKSSTDVARVGLSHKTCISQKAGFMPRWWRPAVLCQPLSEVPGLTKHLMPCRGHRNAGEGELCFYLFYRRGQKLRAELQLPLCLAGQLALSLSLCYPTCNASCPVLGELGRSRAPFRLQCWSVFVC